MATMTLSIGSATAEEAKAFIFAFQRTRHLGLPAQIADEPTVRMAGIGWHVTTPTLYLDHAAAMMCDFEANTTARKVPA